ncbi:MAG: SDR family NAD(P)-dependent oxidoreductase [Cyanobacteriota bacterium]
MAPSIEGQSEVILSAIEKSGIDPEKIEYIEAHGTGTQIGDPIEVMALKNAYSLYTDKKNYCAIGSVKTNIGHLDAASGISGLIKTVLSIKSSLIFPTLHFEKPNSNIDFENSPFFVNNKLLEWNNSENERFAGVSSFGVGGTNVHVILQEYLDKKNNYIQEEKSHLIILSAKTEKSLDDITKNYENISENLNIQDISYTLQIGRKDWNFRRFFIAKSTQKLKTKANNFIDNSFTDYCENTTYTNVFLFSGLGTQKIKSGFEVYKNEPIFKEEFEKCRSIFNNYLEKDIKDIIFNDNNSQLLNTPTYMQSSIFIIQYSMAKLWMSKGIIPDVLLGHSFGEYVAWAISEAILLEDIIKIVSIRGALFEKVSGTMIAVSSKSNEIEKFLNEKIVIANYNAEDFITLSGDLDSIINLELKLKENKIAFTRLSVPHATHCYLLDNIIEEFSFKLKDIVFKNPKIKIISNLTGKYIKENELNLEYIINHTLKPVLFYQGLSELANEEDISFLELGTSDHLIKIIQRNAKIFNNFVLNSSLSSKNTNLSEYDFFLTTLGFLWQKGYKINWDKNVDFKRVSLPLYQFDRKKYWVDALEEKRIVQSKRNTIENMFYIPSWKKTFIKENVLAEKINTTLFFYDHITEQNKCENKQGTKAPLFRTLDYYKNCKTFYNYSNNVIFEEIKYTKEEYNLLFKNLKEKDILPEKIICFLPEYSENEFIKLYFDNLLFLIQEIGNLNFKTEIIIISKENYFITGNENILPEQMIFNCFLRTVKQEYANINVKNIDIDSKINNNKLIKLIYSNIEHKILAIRNNNFWLEDVQKISLDSNFTSNVSSSDIFVITGGLGGIGLSLAEFLAKKYKSKIVIINRSYDEKNISESPSYQKTKEIRDFSECYILKADINDKNDLETIFSEINNKIGKISYFIHSAGIISSGLISIKKSDDYKEIFSVKINATKNIYELCNKYQIKKLILFSSLTTILGGIGETAYISANSFLNSFTDKYSNLDKKVSITTINWCSWKEVGMAKKMYDRNSELKYFFEDNDFSITLEEGNNIFNTVLNNEGITNIFISPLDIKFIQEKYTKVSISNMKNLLKEYLNTKKVNLYERPKLKNTYIEAKTDLELIIKNIWQDNLGIKNIGTEDNFFDLGGHSLLLAKMKIDLEEKLGYELPMSSVFNANTIKELAIHLEEKVNSVVIPLKKQGDKKPLFCVHAVSGTIFPFYPIAKNIDKDTPFYAIQSYGFSENANPIETIEEMASFYISGIKNVQKSGPYIISGWSFGSLVALEIAHQLIKNGDEVEKLIIIDMNAPIGEEFRKSIDEEFLTNRFNIDMKGLFGKKVDSENINVKSLYKVFKGNINASLKYEGKKIDTEIILFRAIENIEEDNLLNWDKISDKVKLFNIKGNHYSIIKSPDFFEKLNNLL